MLFYIDRSLTAPLLFAPGSLSSYPYARTPEELLEKVEEAQRQIEDGGPLSYTQFKRVWQYIVTRSTKERTYVRYINGQKIQRTVTPKLGEKAAHNGNVVYTLENPVKSTVFTRKTESSTASKPQEERPSSPSADFGRFYNFKTVKTSENARFPGFSYIRSICSVFKKSDGI